MIHNIIENFLIIISIICGECGFMLLLSNEGAKCCPDGKPLDSPETWLLSALAIYLSAVLLRKKE